jgi:hypothetical protein
MVIFDEDAGEIGAASLEMTASDADLALPDNQRSERRGSPRARRRVATGRRPAVPAQS